jgi:hypothetical protein
VPDYSSLQRSLRRWTAVVTVAGGVVSGAALAACGHGGTAPPGRPGAVVLASFLHSQSDRNQEATELDSFQRLLPTAIQARATVVAYTVGAHGFTSPRVIGSADFDTSAVDGDNPKLRARLIDQRRGGLLAEVRKNLATVPFSNASDPFGGFSAAALLLTQYPGARRTLLAFGDEVATTPTGCVLAVRDLSAVHRDALISTCSPAIPDLRGVDVELVGAGYSVSDPLPTDRAEGLEALLRAFFTRAGARVTLYGPFALTTRDDDGLVPSA